MDIHHLVSMANQIASYFEAYPDRGEAVAGVAQHLRNFWDPRMRRQIVAYLAETGGNELGSLVREAVKMLAEEARARSAGQR